MNQAIRDPDPVVSVLIPCFNAEPFLAATLDSVIIQVGVTWEAILVDDGSTDRSAEIAARYAPQVTVLQGPRQGVSAARNLATARARGIYYQYLDADDLLAPGTLAARVKALEKSGADMVLTDWQRLVAAADGNFAPGKIETRGSEELHPEFDLAVYKGFWSPLAAILYRAELVHRLLPWREDLPVVQDARFLFDAAMAGARPVRIHEVAAFYRQHAAGSVSSSGAARFWADIFRNTAQIEAIWREAGQLHGDRLLALGHGYANLARSLFPLDGVLYREAMDALRRFPTTRWPKYVRAAHFFTRLVGYERARRWLGRLQKK